MEKVLEFDLNTFKDAIHDIKQPNASFLIGGHHKQIPWKLLERSQRNKM